MAGPERLRTLDDTEAAIWREPGCTTQDTQDTQHEWHTPALATVGPDGPEARAAFDGQGTHWLVA